MRVEPVQPEEASGLLTDSTYYRVLLWNAPPQSNYAWMLDEYNVFDARDAREVIEWAGKQNSTTYEVAVVLPDYSLDRDGNSVTKTRYIRIAGQPRDEGSVTHTVVFTKEERSEDRTE